MLEKNVFIFGSVDFDEAPTTEKLHQSIELQNTLVPCAYQKLTSETEIEQFIHLDMGNEVDLSPLHKMSIEYAEAKKRAMKSAGEIVEFGDINHIAEEKELMGEKVEKLKEEWDSQKLSFYEKNKFDGLDTTHKLLKDVEHDMKTMMGLASLTAYFPRADLDIAITVNCFYGCLTDEKTFYKLIFINED
ncbi:hypothetical protein N665_0190s0063 [Sinapis alba]|nr:hypothetical protein N665_0190s0063 [Sinapis alba]